MPGVTVPVRDPLTECRAALRHGDAARARRLLKAFDGHPDTGDLLELRAQAAYLELDFPATAELWERAYAAYRAADEPAGAVRAARMLCFVHMMVLGNRAVAAGWMARAQTLLDGTPGSREAGWVALTGACSTSNRARKDACFTAALDIARTAGDRDLTFATMSYLGATLVHGDRTEQGMALLDEALAAVAGGEVEDFFILEEIFCQLFSACEHVHDVRRAEQWIRVGEQIAERRRLPAISAYCRTHYGGVLTAAGRWPEAEEALTAAVRLWGLGQRSALRAGALIRLADLRVSQGRLRGGRALLDGLDADALEATARPRAALHLARGQTDLAAYLLEQALGQDRSPAAARPHRCWALLVEAHLAAGRPEAARDADRGDRSLRGAVAERRTWRPRRRWPEAGCAWRPAAIRAAACSRRWPASIGPAADRGRPRPSRPGPGAGHRPARRWPVPRHRPRWTPSSGSRRHATSTLPLRCCATWAVRPAGPRQPAGPLTSPRGRGARPARPRAVQPGDRRAAVHQPARPSSTTSATCWPSSACAAAPRPPPTPSGRPGQEWGVADRRAHRSATPSARQRHSHHR